MIYIMKCAQEFARPRKSVRRCKKYNNHHDIDSMRASSHLTVAERTALRI